MALVSYTRIETTRATLTLADLRRVREKVGREFGAIAVQEIQRDIWAESRFKRTTGKSTRAWTHQLEEDAVWLVIKNPATNKYGTNYPKFVHLTGRSPRDRLMLEVQRYARDRLAERVALALAQGAVDAERAAKQITRTEVVRG